MLNIAAGRLRDDLEKAQVWSERDIDAGKVSFGTKVTLRNDDSGKEEVFTILGPWESDPDNNIISYLSPFGGNLLNRKEGESLTFTINERSYKYTIQKISKGALT